MSSPTIAVSPIAALPDDAFIPMASPLWRHLGLPGRTKTYADANHQLIDLMHVAGRAGAFLGECRRYLRAVAVPHADARRNTGAGTAASVRSRTSRPV